MFEQEPLLLKPLKPCNNNNWEVNYTMDKKIAMVLILFLIVGVVAVSGCTSSDNSTTPANTTMSNASTSTENTTVTNASTTSTNTTYIGNSNTHKFHLAGCSEVSKMNDANKVYFNTRQEAINAGYTPCQKCNP